MAKQFYEINADLVERIKSVMQQKNLRAKSFANELGYNQGSMSLTLNGKRPVPMSLIDAIVSKYGVDKQWLLTGEEPQLPSEHEDTMSLPLIPRDAMAGMLTGDGSSIMAYECEHFIVPVFQGSDFLIRVQGDSMIPTYLSGDIVACKRIMADNVWFQWGKTYVLDTSQGALIKRIEPSEQEGCVKICSDNEHYKPFDLPTTEINGLALITGIIRAY